MSVERVQKSISVPNYFCNNLQQKRTLQVTLYDHVINWMMSWSHYISTPNFTLFSDTQFTEMLSNCPEHDVMNVVRSQDPLCVILNKCVRFYYRCNGIVHPVHIKRVTSDQYWGIAKIVTNYQQAPNVMNSSDNDSSQKWDPSHLPPQ